MLQPGKDFDPQNWTVSLGGIGTFKDGTGTAPLKIIGRAGKRINKATLSNPSISRAHIQISVSADSARLLVRHAPPQAPSELESRIPPEVEAGLLKMLAKKPDERFESMLAVQDALRDELLGLSWGDDESTLNATIRDFEPDPDHTT